MEELKRRVRRKLELVRRHKQLSNREAGYEEAILNVLSMIHELENQKNCHPGVCRKCGAYIAVGHGHFEEKGQERLMVCFRCEGKPWKE